ncbi:MAG: SDR family NAD(P)-dependent oxidoreductase, partial [Acidimicrobiia bacterium]|nr:SDR family NAD(P)-dependent oxidoreductase [Acidimicrobiia bacterium]
MTTLDGATVLITGASGGFGQEMTRQLLATGSNLVLTDLDSSRLETTARSIEDSTGGPGRILMMPAADLSSRAGCEELYQLVTGSIIPDVLINNAGIGMSGRIDQIPWQAWERLLQINLVSVMRLTALFLPNMLERRAGHIVNISSVAGWSGSAG